MKAAGDGGAGGVAAEVRALLTAAEEAAAEIERDARRRAAAIVADAEREARRRLDRFRPETPPPADGRQAVADQPPLTMRPPLPDRRPPMGERRPPITERRAPIEEPTPAAAAHQRRDELNGARIVAAGMLRAGSDRGEVAAHLRRTFDLRHPEDLLEPLRAGDRA